MYTPRQTLSFASLRFLASTALLCLSALFAPGTLAQTPAVGLPARAPAAPVRLPLGVPVLDRAYLLTPGDVLDITVQGHDDFKEITTIGPDGTINYVGVGTVVAAGLTREQLTHLLAQRLVRQILRPQVNVSVQQTHPRQVSMTGQGIHAPGLYDWRPGMTLLDAVAAAGGVSQAPELTDALLLSSRTPQPAPIDLVKLIELGDQAQNVSLEPGDIILMSPRDPAKAFVQVVGQVGHAGPQTVSASGSTLQAVLTQAGGALGTAALSRVQLVHGTQTTTLNLHNILYNINDPAAQARVVAGDVVNIPLNNNHVEFFGEINAPGEQIMPDGETLTLTRALALRGGVTRDADQKTIGIVRTDASGHQVAYAVNEDNQLQGKNKGRDIVLLPDDKIVLTRRRQATTGLGVLSTTIGALFGIRTLGGFLH